MSAVACFGSAGSGVVVVGSKIPAMNVIFKTIFVAVIAVLLFITVCPDISAKISVINVNAAVNNGDDNIGS